MATIAAYDLDEQAGPTLTTYCTNFLFDCLLLLHGHTLCNIVRQVSWCVSVCFYPARMRKG